VSLYNYQRDYDPQVGRYAQSDPIGLIGGVNTYAYVGNNPLLYADPDGLDETLIINRTGGRPVSDGPTNGAWGGGCWSGGQYSCRGHPMGTSPPTDSGDMCYMHHDKCWANCGGNAECLAACNNTLVQELLALPDDPTKWPMPPRPNTEGDSLTFRNLAIAVFGGLPSPLVPGVPSQIVK
jgi:hypothetical protein